MGELFEDSICIILERLRSCVCRYGTGILAIPPSNLNDPFGEPFAHSLLVIQYTI